MLRIEPRFAGTYILSDTLKHDSVLPGTFPQLIRDTYFSLTPSPSERQVSARITLTQARQELQERTVRTLAELITLSSELEARCAPLVTDDENTAQLKQSLTAFLRTSERAATAPTVSAALVSVKSLLEAPAHANQTEFIQDAIEPVYFALKPIFRQLNQRTSGEEPSFENSFRGLAQRFFNQVEELYQAHVSFNALSDLNLMVADNVARDRVYHLTPDSLASLRKRKWKDDVADVAIIGAGPAGLSVGLHSIQSNLNTVVFEAGYVAQSFSDQMMLPVHVMRTNGIMSSLTREGVSPPELVNRYGLPRFLNSYREISTRARQRLAELLGRDLIGNPPKAIPGQDARADVPAARSELFQHFDHVAEAISSHPRGILLERAPVAKVTKDKRTGLFRIETRKGHVQLARNLVVSAGQVGSRGEFIKQAGWLEDFAKANPSVVLLRTRDDLVRENVQVLDYQNAWHHNNPRKGQLILCDPLLGSPEMRAVISRLPKGTTCGVIGGGESGAKAVIELFNLNPGLQVHWFVKERPRGEQFQVPPNNTSIETMTQCLSDPDAAEQSLRDWKYRYGVPITPQTLKDLEEQEDAGKLTIYALGKHFDPSTVELKSTVANGTGSMSLEIIAKDPSVIRRISPVSKPGITSLALSHLDGVLVSAMGYDRDRLHQQGSLTQELKRADLVNHPGASSDVNRTELSMGQNGLCAEADESVYTCGAYNIAMAADSAIFSMPVRAQNIVNDIRRRGNYKKERFQAVRFWLRRLIRLNV